MKYLGAITHNKDLVTKEYVDNAVSGGGDPSQLVDFFYPVGSYYETSDTSFDPNTSWGGTWQLDSAGKVTVASDANDTDFDTVGNTGGSKNIQAHTHAHSLKLPNHVHTTNNPSENDQFLVTDSNNAYIGRRTIKNGTGTSYTNNVHSANAIHRTTNTGNPSSLPSVSGSIGAVSGATTGSSGNLQPYIVVNRWHRTA